MNSTYFIGTIIIAGLLGGLVNAIKNKIPTKQSWQSIAKGLVAALMVPIFLELIKSDIGTGLDQNLYNYFIFGGLCLIAAIFSDKFINKLGDDVMEMAQKAKIKAKEAEGRALEAENKAKKAEDRFSIIINKISEPEVNTQSIDKQIATLQATGNGKKKNDIDKVVKELKSDKYKFRSPTGLEKDTGLNKDALDDILSTLDKQGIAKKIDLDQRILWTIND